MKTLGAAAKPSGGKTAESNVKPSEMLLDLNDDCEHNIRISLGVFLAC